MEVDGRTWMIGSDRIGFQTEDEHTQMGECVTTWSAGAQHSRGEGRMGSDPLSTEEGKEKGTRFRDWRTRGCVRIKSSTHYSIYNTKCDVTVTDDSYVLRDTDVNASSPFTNHSGTFYWLLSDVMSRGRDRMLWIRY